VKFVFTHPIVFVNVRMFSLSSLGALVAAGAALAAVTAGVRCLCRYLWQQL
jgi:hypothetical protein